jgi:chromate transporter
LSGTLAACVVTFFTFLPSFLFIFIGAPLIESTHNNLTFTAPLNAISAAVVGVIVSLGVFFAEHVFIPKASVDVFAIVVALLSLGLLIKWNLSIIKLVLLCAMLGLLRYFIF